ncbi:MAG: hypothetical protein ACXWJD_07430, partial [Burkholderiaceae bacterium]
MKALLPLSVITIVAVFFTTNASSQNVTNVVEPTATPPSSSPTTIYREVMPDGRIVYTDKALKEGKIDHTITVEPPIKGNLWTSQPGHRPTLPPKIERTEIIKAPSLSLEEKKSVADR